MPTVFVDSNVVIYSRDTKTPEKMTIAEGWLRTLGFSDRLVISRQVLHETYVNLIGKKGFRLPPEEARSVVSAIEPFATVPIDVATLRVAWTLETRFGVRFYDARLLASARTAGCAFFLSEDLNDGQDDGGVTLVNPFRHTPEDVLGPAA